MSTNNKFGIPGFQDLFVKAPNSPVVYGLTTDGRWIAFESEEQLQQSGGSFDMVQEVGAPPDSYVNFSEVTTGNPVFDQLYNELDGYLGELAKRGQVINPNIQLTPDKIAEFTKQAESEINPYYSSQLKVARESLLVGQGYSKDKILQTELELEKKYGKDLRTIGENAAERGFAQSGQRVLDQQELAQNYNTEIQNNRRDLSFNAGQSARQFAQQFGNSNIPNLDIGSAPTASAGQLNFSRSGGNSPFYSLSPEVYNGLVGSQEFQQRADIRNRTSQLEGAFRNQQGIDQARQLTL